MHLTIPIEPTEFYFWGVLQAHRVMLEFLKTKITGHPKFYLQMFMFILEKMVPRVELESISTACANVSTLPVTVQKLASSVGAFDSCLPDLEDTAGLEVGGGVALSRNSLRNQSRRNGVNGGNDDNGIVDFP